MRRHNILDVVRAVKVVAGEFPEVTGWWYTPSELFQFRGESGLAGSSEQPVVMAVEVQGKDGEFDRIARRLQEQLNGTRVKVRPYQGDQESERLYRVLSRTSSEANSTA